MFTRSKSCQTCGIDPLWLTVDKAHQHFCLTVQTLFNDGTGYKPVDAVTLLAFGVVY